MGTDGLHASGTDVALSPEIKRPLWPVGSPCHPPQRQVADQSVGAWSPSSTSREGCHLSHLGLNPPGLHQQPTEHSKLLPESVAAIFGCPILPKAPGSDVVFRAGWLKGRLGLPGPSGMALCRPVWGCIWGRPWLLMKDTVGKSTPSPRPWHRGSSADAGTDMTLPR